MWFQQTEAHFTLRGITEQTTKYFYLLTTLDPVLAERMDEDVASAPADNKYSYLKEKLMEVYGFTDDQKAYSTDQMQRIKQTRFKHVRFQR